MMKPPPEFVAEMSRLLPDLEELGDRLEQEPQSVLSRAFPAEDPGLRTSAVIEPGGEPIPAGSDELDDALERQREEYVLAAGRAVRKLNAEGEDADLEPAELVGLEAIIQIEGRPAILILDGQFRKPPPEWEADLEQARANIERTFPSVGRIELAGHPRLDWAGTGFLVAEDVVMTNRHVAQEFCRLGPDSGWVFQSGMTSNIEYVAEVGATAESEFALESVIGVHDTFDLALFRVSRESNQGSASPEPLALATELPDAREGRKLFVVGHPAYDSRNDPEVMIRIFANTFNVKRLQPGELRAVFEQESLLHHDCSTLGGNSGSCVVDLETNKVIGLHFGGRYLEANQAVALWMLTDDPLLDNADVRFE
jgi:Trypsin-like peptidase domain